MPDEPTDQPAPEEHIAIEATQYYTYEGHEYQIGDRHDVPASVAHSLIAQGKAKRADAPPSSPVH